MSIHISAERPSASLGLLSQSEAELIQPQAKTKWCHQQFQVNYSRTSEMLTSSIIFPTTRKTVAAAVNVFGTYLIVFHQILHN
jgi:hypothetical protein